MDRETLLRVEDLRTHFLTRRGTVRAVDGVSFSLGRGETLGLVGESGCGKTITCLSILRLVPQPAGRIVGGKILFNGEDLLAKSEREMRQVRGGKIAIILQDPMTSLNPAFTIGDQIAEAISIHQKSRGAHLWEQVKEMLRMVHIPAPEVRLRHFPHQMSGGMRQRVVGAIALSCQPELLIADEPTTALDVTIQAQYLRLLKETQEALGFSLIFITHDLGIVANVCDRVVVMYAGKIVESAGVRELFKNPQHPYTAALLRCVPKLGNRKFRLASIDGQPPSLLAPAPGCRFRPRCDQAVATCNEEAPLAAISSDHWVSCWKRST